MNTLRERAWWLMRQQGTFTLHDLLTTLCDGSEKNAYHSLMKYVGLLERVGVLQRLKRKAPGLSSLSRGHVIWRLIRDLGRMPPVARYHDTAILDPNSQTMLSEQAADCSVVVNTPKAQNPAERICDARRIVLLAVRNIQQREHCSSKRAINLFLDEVRTGPLQPQLSAALSLSIMRIGGGGRSAEAPRVPSQRTLIRWLNVPDLTPKSTHSKAEAAVLPWMVKALRIKRGLRIPTMQEVHRRLVRSWDSDWGEPISYMAMRRFLQGKLKTVPMVKARRAEAEALRQEAP
ncbi:MAG: hypothetical protein K2Q97_07140 [Burkholderiaceae bacterium]|nr:hypothetical protein [Burkholderiaceae bacterium]